MTDHTCLIQHQSNVYKIKVLQDTASGKGQNVTFADIKPAIRAVLYAEERGKTLPPIDIDNYIVSYVKKYWRAAEKLGFKQHGKQLEAYPYVLIFTAKAKAREHVSKTPKQSREGQRSSSRTMSKSCKSSRPEPEMLANQIREIRSCRRQPVVVLDKLPVPVSKKPDDIVKERQIRTSPRRRIKDSLIDLDVPRTSKRKRYIDPIADENLPFCRSAKKPRLHKPYSSKTRGSQSAKRTSKENRDFSRTHEKRMSPKTPANTDRRRSNNDNSLKSRSPIQRSRANIENQTQDSTPKSGSVMKNGGLSPYSLRSPKNGALTEKQSSFKESPVKDKHKRTSSGFWTLLETLMTPVKMFSRRRTK